MGQHHSHHDHADPASFNKIFAISIGLNVIFTLVEIGFAFFAQSNSLLADASHNFGDVIGIGMAWIANWLLTRQRNERYSYGFKRTTILAAVANALLLILISIFISIESIYKLFHPAQMNEAIVIIVAAIGIVINGGSALLFRKEHSHDLNIKGAYLHLLADAGISAVVVFTGIAIFYTQWLWLDSVVALLLVITILIATWDLLSESVRLIMDAVPSKIEHQKVIDYLHTIPGVTAVHDLHIWGLSTREVALTAHLVMPKETLLDLDHHAINEHLKTEFFIQHVTLQVEKGGSEHACGC